MSDYFGDRPITGHGGPQPDSENPFEQARPFTRGSSSLHSARPLTSSGRPMTSGVGSRPGTSRQQQAAAVPEWLFEEQRRSVVVAWWRKFRPNRIYCVIHVQFLLSYCVVKFKLWKWAKREITLCRLQSVKLTLFRTNMEKEQWGHEVTRMTCNIVYFGCTCMNSPRDAIHCCFYVYI
jgi:hypothetical protein